MPMQSSFIVHRLEDLFDSWHSYTNHEEDEEDDDYETTYVTEIRYLGPLHQEKYILASEMPDFFTDAQLNEGYHSKQEYVEANTKYGNIFKYQKFENADTVEKLIEYSTDWIKNNYHGGLTGFEVTALDLHMIGEDVDPYMVGDRMRVAYADPDTRTEVVKNLTCLSAEYDLYNPEKNRYKIGIPDTTLNKSYGDTTKSGGGGGGGGKPEDEKDEDDDQEAETLSSKVDDIFNWMTEHAWSFTSKWLPGGESGTETSDPNLQSPKTRDKTNPYNMNLSADAIFGSELKGVDGYIQKLQSTYLNVGQTITANKLEAADAVHCKNLSVDGEDVSTFDLTVDGHVYKVLGVPEQAP